jgi:DNA-binding CsgD family transcriptional regulator/tetratricopeptide (TPR) repeat protein
MSAPFVGREQELAALGAIATKARRDRAPAAALVSGDPGSGKTRLLAEVLVRIQGSQSIRLNGFEPLQPVPLGATVELLRYLAKAPGDGPVLDRLAFRAGDARDRDPLRIFEAAHRALAKSGPLVLAIDDLQWIDERSLALVHYLLRSAASERVPFVVLAVARPSPVAASFRSSVAADVAADRCALIELGPLTLADGRSLARSIDDRLDDAAAADVWRRAAGSPFWLEALARGSARDDPSSLIEGRLRDLGADAGSLLAVIAIGARPLLVEDLGGLLEWKLDRVRHAVRELVASGFTLEASGAVGPAHDLIREATTTHLPAAVRRRLHARLATWLEAGAGSDLPQLREALEHRVEAGLPTADLSIRLLSSPQQRLLGVEGLQQIASISDGLEPGSPGQVDIDRRLGELAAVLGDQVLALDRWRRVADNASDPSERYESRMEAARAAYRLRRAEEARAHLERARAPGPADGEAAVAFGSLQAEIELWLEHDTAVGSMTASRTLVAAQRMIEAAGGLDRLTSKSRRACLAAYDAAIDAALQEDRVDDVLRLSDASVVVAEGLDVEAYVAALIRPAFALRPLGHAREAEARCRQAWVLAKEHILPMAMVEAGHGLGRVLRDLGRLTEARAFAAQTVELERRLGHPPRRWGNAQSILDQVDLALGDVSRIHALREAARSEPDPHYELAVHQAVAAWQARLHGPRAAADVAAELAAGKAAAARAGCPRCRLELSVFTAELLARVGLVDEARRELAEWEASANADYLMRRVWRTRARAAIAHAAGDERAAIALLESILDELRGEGLREDLVWALLDLGAAFSTVDRGRAIHAYTEAAGVAEETGAKTQGRLATQGLRRLGVRAWRRGRAVRGIGVDTLTGREGEIASLVADGNSNREIGEALAVSPKTVERHVTNILAKLGLRNRTELASLVRSAAVRDSPDE